MEPPIGIERRRPASFAGLALDRVRIMGVVNVTPDSFSDGGETLGADVAIARGLALAASGADVIDVGGESTRPGASPVPVDVEIARVVPVVRGLARAGLLVSVDTRRSAVMRVACDEGARIINDVTSLAGDPESLGFAAVSGMSVVLMHMQGEPQTMQERPVYRDVVAEVLAFLAERVLACEAAGVPRTRLAVDPGIGFGKTLAHNLALLRSIDRFTGLGCAVLVGVSRKRFIAELGRGEPPLDRLGGSLAAALAAIDGGCSLVRVHDVAETAQAIAVWSAVREQTG